LFLTANRYADPMSTPDIIKQMVETFAANLDTYKSGAFNEAQARIQFINPMFEALGWDVSNKAGYAEAYKDVVHEDSLRIGSAVKAPDYCCRIGGARKFFIEAKKPSVNIKEDIHPAYQLRRYAWSAKLPLSILTDFEEFAVYDCRVKPVKTDKASTARVMYMRFEDYPERWHEIAEVFARESILKGSFDKYAESHKKKRGTASVDAAFLSEIEQWREQLARNITLRNSALSQRELNHAVQQTIDRIIFLRIAEDRGIEDYGRLMSLQNGQHVYKRMLEQFREADAKYNSGLFHFRKSGDSLLSSRRSLNGKSETVPAFSGFPDELSPSLVMDDKVLKPILKSLYYPDSPYEFSVLPADILGQTYEQFLGKVIRLTAGHRAVVEGKPEVKKAGGVYYTPTYIVDYIVKHTVGKLLEGKTSGQVAKLRICDPACGSGSFLLGAYQYLLDWHLKHYIESNPEKWAKGRDPKIYQVLKGEWRLTTSEKKRILLNNIYGVDIDQQAVEVTKLSLLLKVLENETQDTLGRQMSMFHERALPDLATNIKCGNSLIGPDFYDQQDLGLMNEEERYRINVFDWQAEFPEIFTGKTPGFDAVIGNPPYIRIQAMKEWAPVEVEHYKRAYQSASKGNYDIYVVFVEKGLSLLNPKGRLGFILPHKFFNAQYGEPLRRIISDGKHLSDVIHFGDQQVFERATTYTCLLFLDKAAAKAFHVTKVNYLDTWRASGHTGEEGELTTNHATSTEWNFVVGKGADLFERLSRMPVKLDNVADIFVGLQTSADDVFIMDLISEEPDELRLISKALGKEALLEKDLLHPLVSGVDVGRYEALPNRQYILFPYQVQDKKASLITFEMISNGHPKMAKYLLANKERLENREKGKMKGVNWYGYIYLKNMYRQPVSKVCVPRLVKRLHASLDATGSHYLDNVDVGGATFKQGEAYSLLYLTGLLNSNLLAWLFPHISAPFRGGFMSANRQFLSQLPFRTINFSDATDKARHDRMVELVQRMLALHKQLAAAKTGHDKTMIQRQITATDKQIDRLVYELYDLTDEEIAIVEERDIENEC